MSLAKLEELPSRISENQRIKIRNFLKDRTIPAGLGTEEAACSIASINLSLYNTLSDSIPQCMSPILGEWIIIVQDDIPHDIRNSAAWRNLLPFAAGTGRLQRDEKARRESYDNWVWGKVFPTFTPFVKETDKEHPEAKQLKKWREILRNRKVSTDDSDTFKSEGSYYAFPNMLATALYDFAEDPQELEIIPSLSALYASGKVSGPTSDSIGPRAVARAEFWHKVNPTKQLREFILARG